VPVKFKDLILENDDNYLEDKIKKVRKNCSYFIEKNRDMLEQDFFLKRGVERAPGFKIIEKNSRKRKKIFSPENFYFYDYFKPEKYVSREELVPTYGKEISRFFKGMKVLIVFPAGSNYEMYYHPSILDSNYNRYLDQTILNDPPHNDLIMKIFRGYKRYNYYKNNEEGDISVFDDEFETAFQYISHFENDVTGDMSPDEIRFIYDKVMKFIKKHENIIHEHFKEIWETFKEYEEYFEDWFFSEYKKTQKLSKEMAHSEVGLYAPDGFYYIENKLIVNKILNV